MDNVALTSLIKGGAVAVPDNGTTIPITVIRTSNGRAAVHQVGGAVLTPVK